MTKSKMSIVYNDRYHEFKVRYPDPDEPGAFETFRTIKEAVEFAKRFQPKVITLRKSQPGGPVSEMRQVTTESGEVVWAWDKPPSPHMYGNE